MKRKHLFWIGLVAVLVAVATVYGAMTNSASQITNYSNYVTSQNQYLNPLYKFANEVEGILEGTTALPGQMRSVVIYTDDQAISASQTGWIIVCDGNEAGEGGTPANVIFTLPTAATGLTYTFVDANATANDDLYIKAASGDTINGGTAAQYIACKTDSGVPAVTLAAIDATRWIILAGGPNDSVWVADNSPD